MMEGSAKVPAQAPRKDLYRQEGCSSEAARLVRLLAWAEPLWADRWVWVEHPSRLAVQEFGSAGPACSYLSVGEPVCSCWLGAAAFGTVYG